MDKRLIYFWLSINSHDQSIPIDSLEAILIDGSLAFSAVDENSPGNDATFQAALAISNAFNEPLWKIHIDEDTLKEFGFFPHDLYDEESGVLEGNLESIAKAFLHKAERDPEGYHSATADEILSQEDYFWRILYTERDIEKALRLKGFAARDANFTVIKDALTQHLGSEADSGTLDMIINGLDGQGALIRVGDVRSYTAC